jgi:hypothetical protein
MKQLIGQDIGSYAFNPAAKTITINHTAPLALEQILTVVNTTDGLMIYCFADSSLTGSVANNVLTLTYDTTAMSASDSLQIYVDISVDTFDGQAAANDQYTHILLERIAQLLTPMATQDVAGRQRIAVEALPTLSTVTTVGTLTTVTNAVPVGNVATLGGVDPRFLMIDTCRIAYANCIRSKLNF